MPPSAPRLFETEHGVFQLREEWWKHVDLVVAHAGGSTQAHGDSARRQMMELSNARARSLVEPVLTPDERALMVAGDRVYDLHTCARLLEGRPLSEFGFATLCQTHFVRWVPPHAVCPDAAKGMGCDLVAIFDHHDHAQPRQGFKTLRVCRAHQAHGKKGARAHHEALRAIEQEIAAAAERG